MNFLWSLLGALLPAAAGMLVLVIGAFCSLFSLGLFIMPKRLLGVFLFSNNAIYILRQNGVLGRILGKFTYK